MTTIANLITESLGEQCAKAHLVSAAAVERIEKSVPPPVVKPMAEDFVYRYEQQTVYHAILLKLARRVSTQGAAFNLWITRYFQEQATLQRVLDEIDEDIIFLAFAAIKEELMPIHQRYLDAFFMEEFDVPGDAIASTQKRPMVKRKDIQKYLAKAQSEIADPQRLKEVSRTLHKTYSGFVHAAAPQVMELYGGEPSRFHVFGIPDIGRLKGHGDDLKNYFYRELVSANFAAKAFGDAELDELTKSTVKEFEAVELPDLSNYQP